MTATMHATKGRLVAAAVGFPLFLTSIAFGAFNVTGVLARTSERHHMTYAWQGGPLSVRTTGSVTIRQGAGDSVDVSYTSHYSFQRPKISGSSDAHGVTLRAACPGGLYSGNCEINYVVTVPAGANLDVRTGDGALDLDGLRGTITAHTGDGSIHGSNLRSTDVTVTSGDGSVHLQWAVAPRRVVASSGDGSMDLQVPAGSGPYAISHHTGDGSTDIRVAESPAATSSMTLRTGDGSLTVR